MQEAKALNLHPPEISDFVNDPVTGQHAPVTFYIEVFDGIEDSVWSLPDMQVEMLRCGFKLQKVRIIKILT